VRVVASGVCQTDMHVQHQNLPVALPMVLGHEGAGVVERVGQSVRSVKPGDHVVLTYAACGHCRRCVAGDGAYCEQTFPINFGGSRPDGTIGIHRLKGAKGEAVRGHFFGQSSFATYALANERSAVKVPDDLPLELLAPLGCGIQTGAGAVLNSLKLARGATIAIIGTGAVGLAAIMAARASGAGAIIGVDINDARLALASELGATHTINGASKDVAAEIRRITGRGVDAVIDLTGRPEMVALGVEVVAPKGTVALIGSPSFDAVAKVRMVPISMGATVRGVIQGDSVPQLFIPQLIEMYRAGAFPFDRLVKFYDFEQINQAFDDAKKGLSVKPVLRIGAAATARTS